MKANLVDCECFNCGIEYRKRADRVKNPDFCNIKCRSESTSISNKEKFGRNCLWCDSFFIPRKYQVENDQGLYCSNACSLKHCIIPAGHTEEANKKRVESFKKSEYFKNIPSGVDHVAYKEIHIRDGYRWVNNELGVKTQEHRLVMERHIGRKLLTTEIVHHKNENRLDNDIGNLEIMSRAEHARHHMRKPDENGRFLPLLEKGLIKI